MKKKYFYCVIGSIFMTIYAAYKTNQFDSFLTASLAWSAILCFFIICIYNSEAKKKIIDIESETATKKSSKERVSPKASLCILGILAVVFLFGCVKTIAFGGNDSNNPLQESAESTEAISMESESLTEFPEEIVPETESELSSVPPKTINNDVDVNFVSSVRNDATGNWRLARVATQKEVQEYALDYYNAYFESDTEIHAIINFSLNTTNKLAKSIPDVLNVTVYDYVSKEEHDAKALFSGTLLADYEVNVSTGEITQLYPDQTISEIPDDQDDQELSNNPEPENTAETPTPNVDMVWISATGSKYHSVSNCGRMDPNKARQVTKDEAIQMDLEACSKCY